MNRYEIFKAVADSLIEKENLFVTTSELNHLAMEMSSISGSDYKGGSFIPTDYCYNRVNIDHKQIGFYPLFEHVCR